MEQVHQHQRDSQQRTVDVGSPVAAPLQPSPTARMCSRAARFPALPLFKATAAFAATSARLVKLKSKAQLDLQAALAGPEAVGRPESKFCIAHATCDSARRWYSVDILS